MNERISPMTDLPPSNFTRAILRGAVATLFGVSTLLPQTAYTADGEVFSFQTPEQEKTPLGKQAFGLTLAHPRQPTDLKTLGVGSALNWSHSPYLELEEMIKNKELDFIAMFRTGHYWWKNQGFDTSEKVHQAVAEIIAKNKALGIRFYTIGNEPNAFGDIDSDGTTPEQFAEQFHSLVTEIKAADPEAVIIGPSIIGWFQIDGKAWYKKFYEIYQDLYGEKPPINLHNLHPYDITNWKRDSDNQVIYAGSDTDLLISETEDFSNFIKDEISPDEEFLVTEYGMLHCDNTWQSTNCAPESNTDLQKDADRVLETMTEYFVTNSQRLGIKRWFPFVDWEKRDNRVYPLTLFNPLADNKWTISIPGEIYKHLIDKYTNP